MTLGKLEKLTEINKRPNEKIIAVNYRRKKKSYIDMRKLQLGTAMLKHTHILEIVGYRKVINQQDSSAIL